MNKKQLKTFMKDISAAEGKHDVSNNLTEVFSREQLPPMHLLYFLLVKFLEIPVIGAREKVLFTIYVSFKEQVYKLERSKFKYCIYTAATEESEHRAFLDLLNSGIKKSKQLYQELAEESSKGYEVNVRNQNQHLYQRYLFFRDHSKKREVSEVELEYLSIAAIDAFFSWTEHVFVLIAILQGKITTGEAVADFANLQWQDMFKRVLCIKATEKKGYYDYLLKVRSEIRNYMTHGAFGKKGKIFTFHSPVGAVPVYLSDDTSLQLNGPDELVNKDILEKIDQFIKYLWQGKLTQAKTYIETRHPLMLHLAQNGCYKKALSSKGKMDQLIERMDFENDRSINMDF